MHREPGLLWSPVHPRAVHPRRRRRRNIPRAQGRFHPPSQYVIPREHLSQTKLTRPPVVCAKFEDCPRSQICLDGRCHPHFAAAAEPSTSASARQCVFNGCGPDRPCCGKYSFCYQVDGSGTCSHRRARVEAARPPRPPLAGAPAQAESQCIGKECDVFAGQGTATGCCLATLCIEDPTGASSLGGFCQPRR
jgi:hypothetical protein